MRTLNPDIFLSGDVTRSSPVLYHEYLDACSVANIPRGVLGARVYPDTCRIRVEGQIRFEYGYVWTWKFLNPEKNELRIQKYPDTSGRDLNALNLDLKQRPGKTIRQGGSQHATVIRPICLCKCHRASPYNSTLVQNESVSQCCGLLRQIYKKP